MDLLKLSNYYMNMVLKYIDLQTSDGVTALMLASLNGHNDKDKESNDKERTSNRNQANDGVRTNRNTNF